MNDDLVEQAFQKVLEALDTAVANLSLEEYDDFLDRLGGEVMAREDCRKDERGE